MTEAPACTNMRVRKLARRINALYEEALEPAGITIGQFSLLAQLRRSRAIAIGALAELLGSDASTVSRLLRPLERDGLIAIAADAADRRAKAVRLTDAGAERIRAARPLWEAAQASLEVQLGAERHAALRFLLDDAYSALAPAIAQKDAA